MVETELFINIHISTKHPLQNMEEKVIISNKIDFTLDRIENIEDLFQTEVLHGERLHACNVCDNGFDSEDKIKKHIIDIIKKS